MSYKYFATLYLEAAKASVALEQECKLPNGAWRCDVGHILVYDATEHADAAMRLDAAALLRLHAIAAIALKAPAECVHDDARRYIAETIERAKRTAANYRNLFHRNREMEPTMTGLAEKLAMDLEHLRHAAA